MKKILTTISLVALISVQTAKAQGTTYVSGLGATSSGSLAVGSDVWVAGLFRTGTNAGGYALNSVQTLINGVSGNPSGFALSIYSESSGRDPGVLLGSLTGPSPSAGGIFSYAASNTTLSASSNYYIVFTGTTPVATGSYNLSLANISTYDASGGWALGFFYESSANGSSWVPSRFERLQFAVEATAIPEPSGISLFLLGGAWLCARRRFGNSFRQQ